MSLSSIVSISLAYAINPHVRGALIAPALLFALHKLHHAPDQKRQANDSQPENNTIHKLDR